MSSTKHETIDIIIEYGIYAYIFLMFLAKGEGIRNILIFGNFALWLLTLKHRRNLHLLKTPVANLLWIYLGTVLVSMIFSIEPLYSLIELKNIPLKLACLFPVIATVFDDEKKFAKLIHVSFFTLIFIVAVAYYSYIFHDIEMLKPDTVLVHAWHNRFARYICMLVPLSFILYFIWSKRYLKVVLTLCLAVSVFALILSTSRTGYAAFICIIFVWSIYFMRKPGVKVKRIMSFVLIILIVGGVLAYIYVPDVNKRLNTSAVHIYDLNERTQIWRSAVYAIMKRPLTGWGYGENIFHMEQPYSGTPYKEPPVKDPHNVFLQIMFHQGIIGVIPYTLLLLTAIVSFWKGALNSSGIKSYMLVSCVSILIGNCILHAMLANTEFNHLAVVLGLGMAAKGADENSHS